MSSLVDKIEAKERARQREWEINFWRPKDGDILEGTVEDFASTINDRGEWQEMYLRKDDGKLFLLTLGAVLGRLIEEEGVKVGDRVAIKFLGPRVSKRTGRQYKDYILVREEGGEAETEK